MNIQEEIAREIRRVDGAHSLGAGALSEALMPLVRRAQAEALRQAAADYRTGQLSGAFGSREGYTRTWLEHRADRIEKEGAGE